MLVKLTYFKESGKLYAGGEINTPSEGLHLHEIWEWICLLRNNRELPNLMKGHSRFIVLVDVPEHPNNHLHLIV